MTRSMFLTDLQRAALQMLAKSPRGYALSTAVARGFSFEMLQGLVRVGYATAHVTQSARKRRSFRTYGSLRLDGKQSLESCLPLRGRGGVLLI
jgi:hypothetical protein